jgi:hypothetical protein
MAESRTWKAGRNWHNLLVDPELNGKVQDPYFI